MTADFYLHHPLWIVAAVIIGVVGVGRAVRLLVHEDFPPTKWIRHTWITITRGGSWSAVVTCHWCFAPYLVAGSMAWFAAGLWLYQPILIAWWVVHLWAAASYAVSWLVHHDEDGAPPT